MAIAYGSFTSICCGRSLDENDTCACSRDRSGGAPDVPYDSHRVVERCMRQFLKKVFITERELIPLWLLRQIGRLILPRYRFKWIQLDWWDNDDFTQYLSRYDELHRLNTDRRWMLHQLLRLIEAIPGDTAECGVFKGASSHLILCANRSSAIERMHYAFDSFAGLSQPDTVDGQHWTSGDLSVTEAIVARNLTPLGNVQLMRGWIPSRFSEVAEHQFAFVHIDVDLHQPTLDSIRFFYPRMPAGAILVCDDYGCSTCPGATQAIDDFLHDKPEKMLALPDGGGFFIRGKTTAAAASLG